MPDFMGGRGLILFWWRARVLGMKKKFLRIGLAVVIIGTMLSASFAMAEEGGEEFAGTVSELLPELYIKAINPGYSIDGVSNVGEMIEISRNSDQMVSLAGVTIGYTNSSGSFVVYEFPENSYLTGESILLRLASSSDHELATGVYKISGSSGGLAQGAGPLIIYRGEEVLDLVCWTGTEGCYRKFKSGSGESLVRNLGSGEFEFVVGYEPVYDPESYLVEEGYGGGDSGETVSQCKGLEFSELLSYYEDSKAEQFIEVYNASTNAILMEGCSIRYKNKNYALSGMIGEGKYYAYRPMEFSLTKNPGNKNTLELIDSNGDVLDVLDYYNGQKKGTSYAFIGYDAGGKEIWKTTFAPTPGEPNNYQEFRTCEEGKVINEETGNCVKVTTIAEKICGEGQYLNILTGRCKKIETKTEKVCKEGYYLNPETNMCRKIKENTGADYSLTPETYEEKSSFVALYAVLGILGIGLLYVLYEFRRPIGKFVKKMFRRG